MSDCPTSSSTGLVKVNPVESLHPQTSGMKPVYKITNMNVDSIEKEKKKKIQVVKMPFPLASLSVIEQFKF